MKPPSSEGSVESKSENEKQANRVFVAGPFASIFYQWIGIASTMPYISILWGEYDVGFKDLLTLVWQNSIRLTRVRRRNVAENNSDVIL